MLKRFIVVVLFIPWAVIIVFIQAPIEIIRWVITGKDFTEPIGGNFFNI